MPTATEKELAYYVSGNVPEPVNCDYVFSELVNPIFIKDGEKVKVSVSVKYLDQRTKATQISQFDLTLEKDSNWKIVKEYKKSVHFLLICTLNFFLFSLCHFFIIGRK